LEEAILKQDCAPEFAFSQTMERGMSIPESLAPECNACEIIFEQKVLNLNTSMSRARSESPNGVNAASQNQKIIKRSQKFQSRSAMNGTRREYNRIIGSELREDSCAHGEWSKMELEVFDALLASMRKEPSEPPVNFTSESTKSCEKGKKL
jgi:hypothetical protein